MTKRPCWRVQAALVGRATDAAGLLEIGRSIAAANAEKLLEVGLTDAEVSTALLHFVRLTILLLVLGKTKKPVALSHFQFLLT